MSEVNDPPAKPADATEVTEGQEHQQELLDNQDSGDEEFPGAHQTRHQIADES